MTEEEVRERTRKINQDLRQGLDTQMRHHTGARGKQGNNVVGASGRGTLSASASTGGLGRSLDARRSQMSSVHNVFPKFLQPETSVTRAHFVPERIFDKNMKGAWRRFEDQLSGEQRTLTDEEAESRSRRHKAELLHQQREVEKRREINELNEFLKNQARYKQKLDHDYEHERFYGKDPDPSLAYPVEKRRNLKSERVLKQTLKEALDTQVDEKRSRAVERRAQENQEDNFYIDCVQQALRDDREERRQKMIADRELLTSQWEMQKSLNARGRLIQKRRDGLSVFSDTS